MEKRKKIGYLIVAIFFAACWCFFFFAYSYHLHFREQITLFVNHSSYIIQYFGKPAFVAEIAGDYLTQFYLLIGGGAIILTLWLLLFWFGLKLAFKKIDIKNAALWALIPCAAEAFLSCNHEYPLSMVIAITAAVWAFVAWAAVKNKIISAIFAVVLAIILYPLLGVHSFVFALLAAVHCLLKSRNYALSIIILILAIITPLFSGRFFMLTPAQTYCYPLITGYMLQNCYIYLISEISILIIALAARKFYYAWLAASILAISIVVGFFTAVNFRREYIFAMTSEAYFENWQKVEKLGEKNEKYKSYIGAYYFNLAKAKKGKLPEDLLNRYQPAYLGLLLRVDEHQGYVNTMASVDALMECGDMAQAQHSSMLGMTFTPHQRSSRMARRMTEIAIINGEYDAARKYIWLLKHTTLHKHWAETHEKLLNNENAIASTTWIAEYRAKLPKSDTLFFPNRWRKSLSNILQGAPQNKTAADYLLCLNLLNKDLESFKSDYDKFYFQQFGKGIIPRVYQEGLVLCLMQNNSKNEDFARYHISTEIYEKCIDYAKRFKSAGGDGSMLQADYGKTYWFYFNYAQIKN